jgi:hypothetical protein
MDFSLFYKDQVALKDLKAHSWDVFISGFNSSGRVQTIFRAIRSAKKHWLAFPEYGYSADEIPRGCFSSNTREEALYIQSFIEMQGVVLKNARLCVDITGFVRPYLLFLIRFLQENGIREFDAIYTEPVYYREKENTKFSTKITEVRSVQGFSGVHEQDPSHNVLIIGSGYDSDMIRKVAEEKGSCKKIQIFGLPSLRADMYQENVLRAHLAEDALGSDKESRFAPAHDPFITANVLKDIVTPLRARSELKNLYLSPLATKAQVLGFAIYYLWECTNLPASIVFPVAEMYERETSKGMSRIWKYHVELPPGPLASARRRSRRKFRSR